MCIRIVRKHEREREKVDVLSVWCWGIIVRILRNEPWPMLKQMTRNKLTRSVSLQTYVEMLNW